MGWKEESHFRFQYTSDGRSEMNWQPTSVYTPDKLKTVTTSGLPYKEDAKGIFLFFASFIVTTLAYQCVSHLSYVENIPAFQHGIWVGATIIITFLGTIAFLETKIARVLIKVVFFAFCGAYFLYH